MGEAARRRKEGKKRLAGRCLFCPCAAYAALDAHRDTPGAAGGRYGWENMLVACAACHRRVHAGEIVVRGRFPSSKGRVFWRVVRGGREEFIPEPSVLDHEREDDGRFRAGEPPGAGGRGPEPVRAGRATGAVLGE